MKICDLITILEETREIVGDDAEVIIETDPDPRFDVLPAWVEPLLQRNSRVLVHTTH